VMAVLPRRFERYGLRLHPEKTRLLPFGRPPDDHDGKGPATLDLLGFTLYWRRTRAGRWVPALKTRKASFHKAIVALAAWCRSHRHDTVKEQHAALCRRINGHCNYFAVNGNSRSIQRLHWRIRRTWRKWLNRRGSPRPMTWPRFLALLRDYPLPDARVRVQLWRPA
jgi:RNA-directed DNA polymerase